MQDTQTFLNMLWFTGNIIGSGAFFANEVLMETCLLQSIKDFLQKNQVIGPELIDKVFWVVKGICSSIQKDLPESVILKLWNVLQHGL